ncbi:MAG: exonuclease SbcCD subunit D [Planctomycetaceae bacterium]
MSTTSLSLNPGTIAPFSNSDQPMKFLHAADVHLDAQLRGLAAREGAPVELLQRATRDAFRNLISLAVSEGVDFVVIAGDLFDRGWADTRTWLWAKQELQRLEVASIPVYLIRGNHDSLGDGAQRLSWPSNVHEFRGDQPETMRIETLRVSLHGQSYSSRAVTEDLSANYPEAVPRDFNIGLLHTSLTGDAVHATYSPTTPENLKLKGYDYWALGHIHGFQRVQEEGPAIVFPGCTQGRHVNEPDAKGCVLVTVDDRHAVQVEFRALDAVRWRRQTLHLQSEDGRDEFLVRAQSALADCQAQSEGRSLALRLELRGATACHHWLTSDAGQLEARAEVDSIAHSLGDIWVERLDVRTSPPIDVAELRRSTDLLGELLRDLERLRSAEDDELLAIAQPAIAPLRSKLKSEMAAAETPFGQADQIRGWLEQAEGLIVESLGREAAE